MQTLIYLRHINNLVEKDQFILPADERSILRNVAECKYKNVNIIRDSSHDKNLPNI